MSVETWTKIDTSNESSAEFKARRQLERKWERWAWLCDSHRCEWGIFDDGNGPEFVVFDCWTISESGRQPTDGYQVIETTAQLWQALGF